MIAEVIAVGDELTSGQRLDTNSQWLSQRLGEIGIPVMYHSTVGDDLNACVSVFRTAMTRANIIVATGGLGPTADDLTRQAIAEAVGVDLELDPRLLEHIEQMFSRRRREMPVQNRVQAMIPVGGHPVPNPHGTAPGIDIATSVDGNSARTFALPGVPVEMKEMWEETVGDRIKSIPGTPNKVIRHHCLKCFGVGESDCEQMLPDLIRRGRNPSVGITVHRGTITLRITAIGSSEDDCNIQIDPTVRTIHECLGDMVFGEEAEELSDVVMRLLSERDETVAVCEWGTGGLIGEWLGSCDPTGIGFAGGMVLRSADRIGAAILGPSFERGLTSPHDALTEQFAAALAESTRERFGTTYGMAVSAFPDGSNPEQRYSIAVSSPHKTIAKTNHLAAHPDIRRDLAAKQVVNLLRLHILRSG